MPKRGPPSPGARPSAVAFRPPPPRPQNGNSAGSWDVSRGSVSKNTGTGKTAVLLFVLSTNLKSVEHSKWEMLGWPSGFVGVRVCAPPSSNDIPKMSTSNNLGSGKMGKPPISFRSFWKFNLIRNLSGAHHLTLSSDRGTPNTKLPGPESPSVPLETCSEHLPQELGLPRRPFRDRLLPLELFLTLSKQTSHRERGSAVSVTMAILLA